MRGRYPVDMNVTQDERWHVHTIKIINLAWSVPNMSRLSTSCVSTPGSSIGGDKYTSSNDCK